jgi:hypothetical protein
MPAIRGKVPGTNARGSKSDVTGEINSTQTSNQAWTSITRSSESKKEIKKK